MSNQEIVTAVIPFTGFYESIHVLPVDNECEELDNEGKEPVVDMKGYKAEYAKVYTIEYRDLLEDALQLVLNFAFESLESPKEYNFETDRIFVTMPQSTLNKMLAKVDYDRWEAQVKATFTSCDGFSSFYSPNLSDWLDNFTITPLDHNQVGSLLLTLTEQYAEEEYGNFSRDGIEDASEMASDYVTEGE